MLAIGSAGDGFLGSGNGNVGTGKSLKSPNVKYQIIVIYPAHGGQEGSKPLSNARQTICRPAGDFMLLKPRRPMPIAEILFDRPKLLASLHPVIKSRRHMRAREC
ncbi:MAG: hypothetical protein JO166_11695 [Deltaproteobacteria bacterium]|nr:hypothetical protein [Deltaproteobacteria bacterium]